MDVRELQKFVEKQYFPRYLERRLMTCDGEIIVVSAVQINRYFVVHATLDRISAVLRRHILTSVLI